MERVVDALTRWGRTCSSTAISIERASALCDIQVLDRAANRTMIHSLHRRLSLFCKSIYCIPSFQLLRHLFLIYLCSEFIAVVACFMSRYYHILIIRKHLRTSSIFSKYFRWKDGKLEASTCTITVVYWWLDFRMQIINLLPFKSSQNWQYNALMTKRWCLRYCLLLFGWKN